MTLPRLIPILLKKDGGLMKSTEFKDWTYIGDVLNATKIFNEKDVDELVIIDIDASTSKSIDFEYLETLASQCFMPISYGGGISNAKDARRVVSCGVDKVIINTAFRDNFGLASEMSEILGASSVVVSADVIYLDESYWIFDHSTHEVTNYKIQDFIKTVNKSGAGEILIQSVCADGKRIGPDLQLSKVINDTCELPVVYAGGVRNLSDAGALWKVGIDGVAAGSWFVFNGPHKAVLITYPKYEKIIDVHTKALLK